MSGSSGAVADAVAAAQRASASGDVDNHLQRLQTQLRAIHYPEPVPSSAHDLCVTPLSAPLFPSKFTALRRSTPPVSIAIFAELLRPPVLVDSGVFLSARARLL